MQEKHKNKQNTTKIARNHEGEVKILDLYLKGNQG